MTRPRQNRGFTIMELLGVLMLLGAFAVIGTRLFTSTIKLGRNYGDAQDAINSAGFATAFLRAEVANAKDIKTPDPNTAVLTTPADQTITWTIKADQLIRKQGKQEEAWHAPAAGATFAANGTSLILKFSDPDFGELWMSNQDKLTEKLTQP